MTTICDDLRKAVLQAAIQGKLTQQLPEDGNAEDLYREIQAEKQKLIKEGKIKKENPLPAIADDDIPFDIPENWKWVCLGEIVTKPIKRGKSPHYADISNTLVFAQKCNTKAGYIDAGLAQYLDESYLKNYPASEFMNDFDVVINSTGGGTLGRVGIYRDSGNPQKLPIVPDSHVTVIRSMNSTIQQYLYQVLKFMQPELETMGSGSTNQTELRPDIIKALYIPLPPLSEQKRIVARVDELMKRIDEMEKTEKDITALYDAFPGDMKASLLQAAIQGKLTEQLASDGDAETLYVDIQKEKQGLIKEWKIKKEKPLSEILEDDIPFDIPEKWKWVRQAEVCRIYTGNSIPEHIKLEKYMKSGIEGYNYIGTKDVSFDHVIDYENGVRIPYSEQRFKLAPEGSSLICIEGGSAGKKVGFLSQTVCFGNKLCMFNPYLIEQKYIYYWLQREPFRLQVFS